jgi:hypothetical protein
MRARHWILMGIVGAIAASGGAWAQPAGPGGERGPGPAFRQRLMARGEMWRSLSPDEREKLKGAAAKAKEDPAVKAARDKLRGGDRRAAFEELRKAFREAIVKADPTLAETLKKAGPTARERFGKGARLGRGHKDPQGQGFHRGTGPGRGGPGYGLQQRQWARPPQQPRAGFRGPQGLSPQHRGWTQPPQGPGPRWMPPGRQAPACPRGFCPPQSPQRGYGRRGWTQAPQNPPPRGWQAPAPQGPGPGWAPPPHRGWGTGPGQSFQ